MAKKKNQKNATAQKPRKRKVQCGCGCGKMVTTETQKQHLRVQHGQTDANTATLRQRLQRLSSQESIERHHARHSSPEHPPNHPNIPPIPEDFEPEDTPMPKDGAVPDTEIDITALWSAVLQARAPVVTEDNPVSSLDGTNDAGSFQSLTDIEGSEDSDGGNVIEIQYDPAAVGLLPEARLQEAFRVSVAKNAPNALGPEGLAYVKTFNFFVQNKPSLECYQSMQDLFIHKDTRLPIESLKDIRKRIQMLSGIKPVEYHCCKNSCILFAGYLRDLDECPYCRTPRLNPTGKPYSTFWHIPLIPQLIALYSNPVTAALLLYCANYQSDGVTLKDIFDSFRYDELRKTYVSIDGKELPFRFFEDLREIALGLSLDGMCPFKRRKNSCWPIIFINYNLPPEIRTHLHNLLCVGVIPGPHSPKDLNSFLQPVIDELIQLAKGVDAVDMHREEVFSLRAHLLPIFGDIPAITKVLEFIGHNGRHPCRFCSIIAIAGKTAKGGTHLYCPLHRPDGASINPLDLPLCTHDETVRQGYEVLQQPNNNASSRLATEYSIKGVSLLVRLPSVSIPASFPIEIMHMIWINLIPQLVDLWTNDFNGLDDGSESYLIDAAMWKVIGDICEFSGDTIPSSFGCRVPNLSKRGNFIAKSWSLWATLLAPHLLRRRFRNAKYYKHFVRLIKLVKQCMAYEIPKADLPQLRQEFATWIKDYERIYYQHDADRLQMCPVNVHYLLHIVDLIEFMGPPCSYWAFPMERFCSFVGSSVKSCRYPYANIARRLVDVAQLHIIWERYGLHDVVRFGGSRTTAAETEVQNADRVPDYDNRLLLTPSSTRLAVSKQIKDKITKYLSTTFGIPAAISKDFIPPTLKQWGRMRLVETNDIVQARGYHKLRMDGRDSSFVRYEIYVDRQAHRRNAPEDLVQKSHYGQVQHIFTLSLPPGSRGNPSNQPRPLLLALVLEAPAVVESTYEYEVTYYKGNLSSGEVIDASTIQCAVGRVYDRDRWWILDRGGPPTELELV